MIHLTERAALRAEQSNALLVASLTIVYEVAS